MNRFALLGCLSIALSAFACGEPLPAPPATEPEEHTVLQTITQNASWELDMGSFGTIQGDHVIVTIFGNGQSAPVGMEFQLRDSTNFAVSGSFQTTSYQPGGTWTTGIRGLNVGGGPGLLMGAPTSSVPGATITQLGPNSWEVDFSGTSFYKFYPGEGHQFIEGEFTFDLGADLPPDEPAEQEPIPEDDLEGIPDAPPCPVWLFEESEVGVSAILDTVPSDRPDPETHSGEEVYTGWNGSQFVIKMESNLQRQNPYVMTVILDQYPAEGAAQSYPIQVLSFVDNQRTWTVDQPGAATLEIVDWRSGSFYGTVDFTDFQLRDNDKLSTLQYWTKGIEGHIDIYAPLPLYNQAYDQHCTELEEDVGWSIAAIIQTAEALAKCIAAKTIAENYCRATFDPDSEDEEVLLNGMLCFLAAVETFKECKKAFIKVVK